MIKLLKSVKDTKKLVADANSIHELLIKLDPVVEISDSIILEDYFINQMMEYIPKHDRLRHIDVFYGGEEYLQLELDILEARLMLKILMKVANKQVGTRLHRLQSLKPWTNGKRTLRDDIERYTYIEH